MKIVKSNTQQIMEAIKIAKKLSEWFTKEAIKNMKTDFKMNHVIVAIDKDKVIGFLCYTSNGGKALIIWLGVDKEYQRKGIGKRLLDWLEKETKKLGLYYIETETLPEEDDYKPYRQTRNFYYKNGFRRVHYKKASIKGWDDQIVLEKHLK